MSKQRAEELDETFSLYFPEPDGKDLLGYDAGGAPIYSAEFSTVVREELEQRGREARERLARHIDFERWCGE